jgi:5-methylcytosine-specific restriction endonuclease McrA
MRRAMSRRCRKCGNEFPLTKEFFGHQPNGNYRYTCRQCVRDNVRRLNWENPYRSRERTEMRRDTVFTQAEHRRITAELVARDGGFRCYYCKTPLAGFSHHIDHKIPYARGGAHQLDNWVLACLQCNQEKHSKTIDEYRMWLRYRGEAVHF